MKKLIALMLLLGCGAAQAIPVTWNIDSLVFDDGGTGSGSFVYDADINTYSAISIVTTSGSVLGGATYNFVSPVIGAGPAGGLFVGADTPDLTGTPGLFMLFGPGSLSNGGGTLAISSGGQEAPCANSDCTFPSTPARLITSGQITGVPIPAAVWLFASGLGLLGFLRRKSQA